MNSRPFLFDIDFRRPNAQNAARDAAAIADAEASAYARGLEEGRQRAESQAQARLSDALNRLGLAASGLLSQSDARDAEREDQAITFATALARKLAGDALAASPLAPIEEAARSALQHVRGVPHLVVRVNQAIVDDAEILLKRLARERGFEGRLVVLGEPDLPEGDARIEWADGGIIRERARVETAAFEAAGVLSTRHG